LTDTERKPLIRRVSDALRVLAGREGGESTRAIIPTTYPNFPGGQQQMALVRTANPGEYRYDGATVRNQGFNKHPVVHSCIRVVADIVASVPLVVLQERGNYESRVAEDHPLQKLLDYPGPRFTARQFRARYAVDFLGYGNAFFQIERPAEGRLPVGLRAVNAESMQQVWIDPEGDPRRYDYANWAGIIVNVPVEDMLHFRDLDMGRPFEAEVFGYPRGATAIGSLLADNEATQYVRQVVTNDGTPTFAVLMADEATSEDASAMQDRYRARVVDRGKRGTPAFFGAVKDIKPLGFTLSDLEFPDLRRVSREDICAAFGVDPRMIGIASASSDAGLSGIQYAEARARLVQHTIEPMFSALEDELNHWLAPEFGDVWVTYDHDKLRDLVENDTETSTRIRAEYAEGLRTWEESRTALKLSPLPEPTDSILKVAGRDLIPAAVAVIDPSTILDRPPATDNETPALGAPTPAEDIAEEPAEAEMLDEEEMPEDEMEAEDEEEGVEVEINIDGEESEEEGENEDELEDEDETEGRADPVTNFPAEGDDKKVTLRNSQWALFPVGEAEDLKENYPELWSKAGNEKGNEQFRKLAPIAKRGGVPDGEAEENAIRLREAWIARHRGDFQLNGVIAQVKWLAVGDRGIDHMRKVLREAKAKLKDRSEPEMAPAPMDEAMARKRGIWERAMQELDRTEQTYKATAEALFRAERPKVTRSIASAGDLATAKLRVVEAYRTGGELEENWRETYTPLVAKSYAFGATEVAGSGADLKADVTESGLAGRSVASVREAIRRRAARLAELIGDTTAREVLAVIEASERAGLSVTETSRLVGRAVYGEERVTARSTAIARTESAGALSQGSWDQAQEMGDLYRSKEWLAFSDAETRETHTACMAQGRIGINEPFTNGLMYPLDPTGPADEVINCRCVLAYSDEVA
jgi:HK97 family phage portal protein